MLKRKVWPIFAWASGVLFVTMLGLIWATNFVDDRYINFVVVNVITLFLTTFLIIPFNAENTTYEKKPRGWRKERRRAEKEAYVRKLEQELLDD